MKVSKRFHFDAAHKLPNYKGKCANLHGHRWELLVGVEGKVDSVTGFVVDFSVLQKTVEENVLSHLDHSYLNDRLPNPSCENLLFWIRDRLRGFRIQESYRLSELRLYETPDSYAELSVDEL